MFAFDHTSGTERTDVETVDPGELPRGNAYGSGAAAAFAILAAAGCVLGVVVGVVAAVLVL
jgi:hypothetical protein